MKAKDLSPNLDNPRVASEEKLAFLKNCMVEFGDLGSIVFNRKTKRLVGGHQRSKLFGQDAPVTIEKKYAKPTRTGTVAEGFITLDGERFKYREVSWDSTKEKAANIAANKSAGDWDMPKLANWLSDLDELGFDSNLTMFDEDERASLLVKPDDKDQSGDTGGNALQREVVACPQCGYLRGLTPGKKK